MGRPAQTLALSQGELRGFSDLLVVVAFFNSDGISMEGAIASSTPKWFGYRDFMRRVFEYVFDTAGCRRFVVRVDAGNEKALKLDLGLGFKMEGTLRQAAENGNDVHVLGMLRDECRWLGDRNGREILPKTAATG